MVSDSELYEGAELLHGGDLSEKKARSTSDVLLEGQSHLGPISSSPAEAPDPRVTPVVCDQKKTHV